MQQANDDDDDDDDAKKVNYSRITLLREKSKINLRPARNFSPIIARVLIPPSTTTW